MGDHRATIRCYFSMHGHEASQEWYINHDVTACDHRIVRWFDDQVAAAMARWTAKDLERRHEAELVAETESADQAVFDLLKKK